MYTVHQPDDALSKSTQCLLDTYIVRRSTNSRLLCNSPVLRAPNILGSKIQNNLLKRNIAL